MKNILLLLVITLITATTYAQNYNGKYVNSVNQTLMIYNQDDQDFDFEVMWGVNDEWGCMFTASGTAKFTSGTEAYYGDDAEDPEIGFFFGEGDVVGLGAGLFFMGMDCAKFGDSDSDKYTSFKKLKEENVSIDQVNEFVASFYNSLELTDEENQRHYETGDVEFNINNFNQLINSDSKFSTKRVDQLTGTYHDRCHISLVQTKKVEINAPIITVVTNVKYGMFEMGNFFNNEQLTLVLTSGKLKLLKWEDINLEKMYKAPYDHMQDFNEKDFYQALGSINR